MFCKFPGNSDGLPDMISTACQPASEFLGGCQITEAETAGLCLLFFLLTGRQMFSFLVSRIFGLAGPPGTQNLAGDTNENDVEYKAGTTNLA